MATNKNQTDVIPVAIQTLLDKRTRFQDWLAKLEDVVSDFRPEVAKRVQSDYEKRLRAVESELGTHTSELETSLASRVGRLEELAREHDSKSADLEEAQLRHEVGEYTQSEWEKKRSEHGSALDDLSKQLNGEKEAVEELEAVLAQLTGKARPSLAASAVPDFAAFGDPVADESADAEVSFVEVVDEDEDEEDFDIDEADDEDLEIAEVDAVDASGNGDQAQPFEVIPAGSGSVARRTEGDDVFLDELEFLESLSMDESQNFDAVSQLLEEEDAGSERGKKDA